MRFKGIGKKIRDKAYKLAMPGCSCGGECGKCGICHNSSRPMSQDERQNHGREIRVITKSGGDGMS